MAQTLKYVIGKDYRPLTVLEAKGGNTFSPDYDKNNWVQARQYEDSLRQVFVEITNEDGSTYDLTGANVLFEGILPDNEHKILDNSHVVFYEDPTTGKFRFDLPAPAFAVAGQYKQAFFRVTKGYRNLATLEFKFEVLADMVIGGLVPRDYISPLEEFFNVIKDEQTKDSAELKKIVDDKVVEITNLMTALNQTNTATLSELNGAKTALEALENKIKQDGLFTQGEAEAFKQEIEQELAKFQQVQTSNDSDDGTIKQITTSLFDYVKQGNEVRNTLDDNVLRVGVLNLALDGAVRIGIDVQNFWSETSKASERLTENVMALEQMGCHVVGVQEVLSSAMAGAYTSFNRAMQDTSYHQLYIGLNPAVNDDLQKHNGMREGNAIFSTLEMAYVDNKAFAGNAARCYIAYKLTFNGKNILVISTHNDQKDTAEFRELAELANSTSYDGYIILADTNTDPSDDSLKALLDAGFKELNTNDNSDLITEPEYSGHFINILYRGSCLTWQKTDIYDVTKYQGSDHKALAANFKVE